MKIDAKVFEVGNEEEFKKAMNDVMGEVFSTKKLTEEEIEKIKKERFSVLGEPNEDCECCMCKILKVLNEEVDKVTSSDDFWSEKGIENYKRDKFTQSEIARRLEDIVDGIDNISKDFILWMATKEAYLRSETTNDMSEQEDMGEQDVT